MGQNPTRVPDPFDESEPVEWSPLWSLSENRFRFLPTAYCYCNYPLPDGHRFCFGDSNGCAAGVSLEEAILQGFFELVERDCIGLWWYKPGAAPGSGAGELRTSLFRRGGEQQGRCTPPTRRPSPPGPPLRPGAMTGVRAENLRAREIALARALTELNQSLAIADQPVARHRRSRPALPGS